MNTSSQDDAGAAGTEAALRRSEELFRKLFQDHSAIKLIIDAETARIVDANHAAVAFYGWTAEQLRGMYIFQINTLPWDAIKAQMAEARANHRNSFEFRHRRADGSIRDVEVYCNRIQSEGRDLLYSIIHDITARKQAELARSQLEDRNRQLEKAESLNRMAGAIAHLFNNQLHAVLMSQELAMNEFSASSKAAEYLVMAQQSAREASRVSTLMLTYLGEGFVRHEPLDFSALCREGLQVFRATVSGSVQWLLDFPEPGPLVETSAEQVHQLLGNLVTNACEAYDERDAVVRVKVGSVGREQLPTVNRFPVSFVPAADTYAFLEVADSGCGIEPSHIERLFEPFYSTKFVGRGMGLSVVLGIVRAHAGAVSLESAPGHGSAFRVFLPVVKSCL